jgi:hypothetical protein
VIRDIWCDHCGRFGRGLCEQCDGPNPYPVPAAVVQASHHDPTWRPPRMFEQQPPCSGPCLCELCEREGVAQRQRRAA